MVEIMIAVALISLVMVFVFNLLVDLRQEETLSNYKSQDQLNRSIITKYIQDDFLTKGIKKLAKCSAADSSGFIACIDITFKDNTSKRIKINQNYFYYGVKNDMERWKLSAAKYSNSFAYCYKEVGEYYYIQFLFPVDMTDNVLESRMIFDIELLHMGIKEGDMSGIPTTNGSLGATRTCDSIT